MWQISSHGFVARERVVAQSHTLLAKSPLQRDHVVLGIERIRDRGCNVHSRPEKQRRKSSLMRRDVDLAGNT